MAETLNIKMESPRVLIAPIIGFVALQLHRHMSLPWTMELLVSTAAALPYMMPPKSTREIGIQTDSNEVVVRKRTYNSTVLMSIGLLPFLMILGRMF